MSVVEWMRISFHIFPGDARFFVVFFVLTPAYSILALFSAFADAWQLLCPGFCLLFVDMFRLSKECQHEVRTGVHPHPTAPYPTKAQRKNVNNLRRIHVCLHLNWLPSSTSFRMNWWSEMAFLKFVDLKMAAKVHPTSTWHIHSPVVSFSQNYCIQNSNETKNERVSQWQSLSIMQKTNKITTTPKEWKKQKTLEDFPDDNDGLRVSTSHTWLNRNAQIWSNVIYCHPIYVCTMW